MKGSLMTTISTLPEIKAALVTVPKMAKFIYSDLHHVSLALHERMQLSAKWGGAESLKFFT